MDDYDRICEDFISESIDTCPKYNLDKHSIINRINKYWVWFSFFNNHIELLNTCTYNSY